MRLGLILGPTETTRDVTSAIADIFIDLSFGLDPIACPRAATTVRLGHLRHVTAP
jgi:hypothetical protein